MLASGSCALDSLLIEESRAGSGQLGPSGEVNGPRPQLRSTYRGGRGGIAQGVGEMSALKDLTAMNLVIHLLSNICD